MLSDVELDGPYITYNRLNSKLPCHLRTLPLEQAEELVDHLAALPEAAANPAWRDYLHSEMALAAYCRDDLKMCRRHKQRLSNPESFLYDRPLTKIERKLHKQLFGRTRGSLTLRLNFQRMRAAMRDFPNL